MQNLFAVMEKKTTENDVTDINMLLFLYNLNNV